MQSTARKKFSAFLLLLALMLSLLTGCAADPASSNPSSDMPSSTTQPSSEPSSSALSSNPSTSSEPELPPLNLSIPLQGEAMHSTICCLGYIDQNNVFYYSPLWNDEYAQKWPNNIKDIQNIKNGTSGAKSVDRLQSESNIFILMQDGTFRLASLTHLDSINGSVNDGSHPILGDQDAKDVLKLKNVDAFETKLKETFMPLMPEVYALAFTASKGGTFCYAPYDIPIPSRKNQIVQTEVEHGAFLYADGTIGFSLRANGTSLADQYDVDFLTWTNLVQIEGYNSHDVPYILGLRKDGTLLDTRGTNTLPEKYCSNIIRIFDSGFIQHRDGSILSISPKEEIGTFPVMDQIISVQSCAIGVDIAGKVHLLSGSGLDPFAKWALTLTDVKTVWND